MVDNAINSTAHELAEAVVDPINTGGWSDPIADKSDDGGEIVTNARPTSPAADLRFPMAATSPSTGATTSSSHCGAISTTTVHSAARLHRTWMSRASSSSRLSLAVPAF